jgi:hypothetical protein
MRTKKNGPQEGRIWCSFLAFMLFVIAACSASAEIIPAARRITWQGNVGVSGDIPAKTNLKTLPSYTSYNNYGTAAQTVINSCLSDSSYGGCYLPAGTYKITGSITIPSNKVLRGAGMGLTSIKASSNVPYFVGIANSPDYYWSGTARTINAGATKGSTSITTSVAHGWSVGDYILIDQLEDPSGDPSIDMTGGEGECTACASRPGRPIGQIVRLIAPTSGSTATLEMPLYKTYDKTPQAVKMGGITTGAGLEEITLDSTAACPDGNYGTIHMANAVNSWILNTEISRVCRTGLQMLSSYRNTIRGIKIHDAQAYSSNGGYGFWMMGPDSANLIENSIFYNMLTGIVYTGGVTGNVFGYNYFTLMHNNDYPTAGWLATASHGTEPWMNLWEGNYVDGNAAGGDNAWGGTAYNTYLRNKIAQKTSGLTTQMVSVSFGSTDYYMNMVGNVLGTASNENQYETTNLFDGKKTIYFFGSTATKNSTLRHGNWDSYNKVQVWDTTIADHSIPNSLYLPSSPSPTWWCSQSTFPPVNPATPSVSDIPAKRRYNGATCTLGGSTPDSLSPPPNFHKVP